MPAYAIRKYKYTAQDILDIYNLRKNAHESTKHVDLYIHDPLLPKKITEHILEIIENKSKQGINEYKIPVLYKFNGEKWVGLLFEINVPEMHVQYMDSDPDALVPQEIYDLCHSIFNAELNNAEESTVNPASALRHAATVLKKLEIKPANDLLKHHDKSADGAFVVENLIISLKGADKNSIIPESAINDLAIRTAHLATLEKQNPDVHKKILAAQAESQEYNMGDQIDFPSALHLSGLIYGAKHTPTEQDLSEIINNLKRSETNIANPRMQAALQHSITAYMDLHNPSLTAIAIGLLSLILSSGNTKDIAAIREFIKNPPETMPEPIAADLNAALPVNINNQQMQVADDQDVEYYYDEESDEDSSTSPIPARTVEPIITKILNGRWDGDESLEPILLLKDLSMVLDFDVYALQNLYSKYTINIENKEDVRRSLIKAFFILGRIKNDPTNYNHTVRANGEIFSDQFFQLYDLIDNVIFNGYLNNFNTGAPETETILDGANGIFNSAWYTDDVEAFNNLERTMFEAQLRQMDLAQERDERLEEQILEEARQVAQRLEEQRLQEEILEEIRQEALRQEAEIIEQTRQETLREEAHRLEMQRQEDLLDEEEQAENVVKKSFLQHLLDKVLAPLKWLANKIGEFIYGPAYHCKVVPLEFANTPDDNKLEVDIIKEELPLLRKSMINKELVFLYNDVTRSLRSRVPNFNKFHTKVKEDLIPNLSAPHKDLVERLERNRELRFDRWL